MSLLPRLPHRQPNPLHPIPHIPKSPATTAPAPSPKESAEEPDSKSETAVPASIQLAAELRKRATSVTETYIAYSVCEKLIKECAMQADYSIPQRKEKNGVVPKGADGEDLGVGKGWWYEDLGLAPTFSTWAQITFLHMYILTVRLRAFPAAHAPSWHQHLLDHFFYAAEDRLVRDHNIQARSLRNKYLKDLFTQWRGLLAGLR
ncbi:Serine carboxypeptidase 3 [Xanthoria parietina]